MFCKNCGTEINDQAAFCPSCGAKVGDQPQAQAQPQGQQPPYQQAPYQQAPYQQPPVVPGPQGPTERNIGIAILLSIITCGIYAIYWFITLTNEVNAKYGDPNATSGGVAFLLTLVTCGIYGYFWAYKLGEKVDAIKGNPAGNSNILYLVFEIFGLNIVTLALAQDSINKY